MQVSASASKIRLQFRLPNLYAHFTCVKFNVSYLNAVQTWWAGSNFTQFLHKIVFYIGFIFHHNMEGVHFKNFDFYFLHWFMQCPIVLNVTNRRTQFSAERFPLKISLSTSN